MGEAMSSKRLTFNSVAAVLAKVMIFTLGGGAVAHAAEAADPAPSTLQPIIVTAQKRVENLQNVPVSISVVSGQKVADMHIDDLRVLQGYIPNLAILNSGVNPIVYIRGFGSGPNNVAFDQEVSVYDDGVYGGRAAQFTAPFFDVARIEVLRGPQGALFGKNTAAGAISIVSAGPTASPEARVTGLYDFERRGYDLSGYVSGPLSDTLSGRLAVKLVNEAGWLKNVATGNLDPHLNQDLARLTLLWRPNDRLDVTGKLEYGRHHLRGGITLSGYLTKPTDFGDKRYVSNPYGPSPQPEESGITSTNAAVTANYHLSGGFTLTSVTGYSKFNTVRLSAYDEFNPDQTLPPNGGNALYANGFPEHYDQLSEEVRLLSPTGQRLEYLVGLYYDTSDYHLHQDTYYRQIAGVLTGHQSTDFYQYGKTYSAFGQATFHATDRLRLIGSLRYSQVEKSANFSSRTNSGTPLNRIVTPVAGSLKEHYADPSGTIQFDLAPHVMVYATAARGSKSGGFVSNTYTVAADTFQFRPERSTNYEVGLKSLFAGGRVQANLAIFDMKFKDLQQSAFDPDHHTFLTRNAARASSKGVEADLEWLVLNNLQVSANVAYLDAKFDDYPGAPCLDTETLAQCNSGDPASLAAHNVKGLPLQFAPKWSGNIGLRHTLELPGNLQVVSSVNALFRSKYYVADGYNPIWGVQDGWVKLDARVQIGPDDDRWHVALVGRNLTDEHTVGAAIRFPGSITAVTRTQNWMDEYRSVAIEGAVKVW